MSRYIPYDHSKKVGNEGDVVKHVVLARVADYLIGQPRQGPFIYAESHTGRAKYVLQKRGEWEKGVKKFFSRPILQKARESWKKTNSDLWELANLKSYVEPCLPVPTQVGATYRGSSYILFRMLQKRGLPFRFHLWEKDAAVCENLLEEYARFDQIEICRADGLKVVRDLKHASLVLVDPSSLEDEGDNIIRTLANLSKTDVREKSIPLICWTPLKGAPGDPLYSDFKTRMESENYFVCQIAWGEKKEKRFWGCQLTVSPSLAEIVHNTLEDLAEVMPEWRE